MVISSIEIKNIQPLVLDVILNKYVLLYMVMVVIIMVCFIVKIYVVQHIIIRSSSSIGGGGEGSTAREVLRHSTVERCVMVDIDEDVVRFCRDHLPENTAAFADSRLELVIDDAKAVLEKSPTKFDIIIMDLDDPLEGGPCYQLYTVEFYKMCLAKLNPGGVFVTQSGQAGVKRHHLVWSPVNSTLRQVFPSVKAYNQAVYSFMDEWGWNMAYVDPGMELLEPEQVDQRIAERITGGADALRFLDGESYRGLFCLSKAHRKTLGEEKRVLSRERGTFALMHSQGLCVAGSSGNGSAH